MLKALIQCNIQQCMKCMITSQKFVSYVLKIIGTSMSLLLLCTSVPQDTSYIFRHTVTDTVIHWLYQGVPSIKNYLNTTAPIPDTKTEKGAKGEENKNGLCWRRGEEIVCRRAERGDHGCLPQSSLCQLLPCCPCWGERSDLVIHTKLFWGFYSSTSK